ncbi:hypothetical protein IFM89_032290 [Coptis chinensis]|uniref:Uncharacterized protein n=1 Tax=Coptis chinensis TaxID=261450 RepID=A0A835H1Y3_9MAGN|nr:hypothetical protein IFM89_032290 [Coptis chinensis]
MARVSRFILGIIVRSIEQKVLFNKELAAVALSAGFAIVAGPGAGAVGALGALAVGATGPIAVVGFTATVVDAAVASGIATEKGTRKDGPTAASQANHKVLRDGLLFSSLCCHDNSMLSVLLLLSKYRLRSVPIIETGNPFVKNFNTQSAVVQGLQKCKGRDRLITLQVTQYLILDFLLRRMRR